MSTDNPNIIMARIEALGEMAVVNARNFDGDDVTAAFELMCAFVLIEMRNGADPDRALKAIWEHAKATCADFWGNERRMVQ